MNESQEKMLKEKIKIYTERFGDKAFENALLEKENDYLYFGKSDYIEIVYQVEGEAKHLRIVGDFKPYIDYVLAKINSKYEMMVLKRINGTYYPLETFEIGDFL